MSENDLDQTNKKYFEVIGSDVLINGKIYQEGAVIDTYDEALKDHLKEISESQFSSNSLNTIVASDVPRKRGRQRKP